MIAILLVTTFSDFFTASPAREGAMARMAKPRNMPHQMIPFDWAKGTDAER
jgi:hypothetical protein